MLVVDDDMRNIFATRVLLEGYGMTVLEAGNGIDAIAVVDQQPDLALVLMDIMMPEMDGYQTIEPFAAMQKIGLCRSSQSRPRRLRKTVSAALRRARVTTSPSRWIKTNSFT